MAPTRHPAREAVAFTRTTTAFVLESGVRTPQPPSTTTTPAASSRDVTAP
jgi:hypothetical protein